MMFRKDFPFDVLEVENCWIPLKDGERLAARLFLPKGSDSHPVPAILEYMPYRKRDNNRNRDQMIHTYFAGHGYGCVRVDTRGSGDSSGVLKDEFAWQEQEDGMEIISWIVSQEWCDGKVGMIGKSWSAFSALQLAARKPKPLVTIVVACAGIDRYRQGLHYHGGCYLTDNVHWASTMLMLNGLPPDLQVGGEYCASEWSKRLDANHPWSHYWLEHQTADDYYEHGSISASPPAVECPIYFVGGWYDHFASAVAEVVRRFPQPIRGIVGPWGHHFPHDAKPGPSIGWLQDCVRWWDRWLKGKHNGIDEEPRYFAWMFESSASNPSYSHERPGRWVVEDQLPLATVGARRLYLNCNTLDRQADTSLVLSHLSPLSVGMCSAGDRVCIGLDGELPLDQRADDGKSLVFDSEPLAERLEILGAPKLTLEIAANRPSSTIAVRLNDVAPDGTSSRVSYGFLNLTHRNSSSQPEPLVPEKFYRVEVTLNDAGIAIPAGNRIRLAISTSYWPHIWPSPELATIHVRTGSSFVDLPEYRADSEKPRWRFAKPEMAMPSPIRIIEPTRIERVLVHDQLSGRYRLTWHYSGGYLGPGRYFELSAAKAVLGHERTQVAIIDDLDPLSASMEVSQSFDLERGGARIKSSSRIMMTATQDEFIQDIEATVTENDTTVWEKQWREAHRRVMV